MAIQKPTYSPKATGVDPVPLDERALLTIGRIIRACAEMEDLVNLFICNLAEISETKMVVMLGKTNLRTRAQIAEYFSKLNTPQAQELAKWAFSDGFWNIQTCRNCIAHGVLLGKDEDGHWTFLTSRTETPEGTSAIQLVAGYTIEHLEEVARVAEEAIPQYEDRLRLKGLRQARYGRPLSPHRKGLPQQKRGAKPPRPQKPSQR
jgi:hypothetical protein